MRSGYPYFALCHGHTQFAGQEFGKKGVTHFCKSTVLPNISPASLYQRLNQLVPCILHYSRR